MEEIFFVLVQVQSALTPLYTSVCPRVRSCLDVTAHAHTAEYKEVTCPITQRSSQIQKYQIQAGEQSSVGSSSLVREVSACFTF